MPAIVSISPAHLHALRDHLFLGEDEQAAFGFAFIESGETFRIEAIECIPPTGFAFQSDYHIELSSETQARLIKQAFDLRACLVEFHSHRTGWPARFSSSDFSGFEEFVPHVRWRLTGRPYAAVVFHESSFDGLAWINDSPAQLDRIDTSQSAPLMATRLSLRNLKESHGR